MAIPSNLSRTQCITYTLIVASINGVIGLFFDNVNTIGALILIALIWIPVGLLLMAWINADSVTRKIPITNLWRLLAVLLPVITIFTYHLYAEFHQINYQNHRLKTALIALGINTLLTVGFIILILVVYLLTPFIVGFSYMIFG